MEGWIKFHRKILDNPIVCKDSDYFAVWCYLLLNATHTEYDAMFKGERITLKPGQLLTGRKSISKQFKIDESKVKRILISLENDQQIDRQRSSQNSLISILNWGSYQNNDQQNDQTVTSDCPASDQQVTTNKNVKKEKNDKECKENNIYTQEKEIFDYWNSKKNVCHSKKIEIPKLTTILKKYTLEEIKAAVDRLNTAVDDEKYYYCFKWNLYKFIKQNNGISNWVDDGQFYNDYKQKRGEQSERGYNGNDKQYDFSKYEG